MLIGIIGLQNSGKSTLFEVMTEIVCAEHERMNVPRHGIMTVPDDRLDFLEKAYKSAKVTNPTFEIVDLPPIKTIKSSVDSKTNIMEEIRSCNALLQVVRKFSNPAVAFTSDSIDPAKEKDAVDAELTLIDQSIIENRIARMEKQKGKKADDIHPLEPALLKKCLETLENEQPLSSLDLNDEEAKLLRGYQFLTLKPRITVVNIDEDEIETNADVCVIMDEAFPTQAGSFLVLCCQSERELLDIEDEEEREEFRKDLGIKRQGQFEVGDKLVSGMNLSRFLTGGPTESRSWLIKSGISALEAAGTIHSDIERGFIRAEVVAYDQFIEYGTEAKCKEAGKYRLEGKQYIVKDGDIIYFRFNV